MTKLKLREPDRNCLHSIHQLIANNPFCHFTIESLAHDAGINKNKLSYGFKQLFNMGVYEYLVHLRMEKAEKYLLETDKDVKEIAKMTGYKNSSSFTISFKKKHGMAPGEWRKVNSILSAKMLNH